MKRWIVIALLLPCAAWAERKWRQKDECTLVPNESNDGDSFHVKWHTQEYIFRLLYVDTPESEDSLPDRVAEQAAYFGISPQDAVRAGKIAKKFSADWLKEPFTAWTQFDDARGRSVMDRDYAMITRGDEILAVTLVANGLARIFGKVEAPEELISEQAMRFRLSKAEREAKEKKLGAWAFSTNLTATPFAPLAPPPAPAAPTAAIAEQTLAIARTIQVFSLVESGKMLGYLTPGKEITVLKAESPTMVRVRFTTAAGQVYEAQCRRADLGL